MVEKRCVCNGDIAINLLTYTPRGKMKRCIDCKHFRIGLWCHIYEGTVTWEDVKQEGGFCKLDSSLNIDAYMLACKAFQSRPSYNQANKILDWGGEEIGSST